MDNSLVSIITPVFNGAQFLDRCIQSVLSQSYEHWELLLIDDSSTDNSIAVIEPYLSDQRINLLRNESNSGISKTRNKGIQHSKGDFVALLDQDDEWLENKLSVQVKQLDSLDASYGLVYSNLRVVLDSGVAIEGKNEIEPKESFSENLKHMLLSNRISSPTVVIRKKVIEEMGAFDESILWGGDDYDLWLKIASKYKFGFRNEILCVRHEHGDNYSSDKKKMMQNTIALTRNIIDSNNIEPSFFRKVSSSLQYRYGIEALKDGKTLEGLFYISKAVLGSTQGLKELAKTIRNRF